MLSDTPTRPAGQAAANDHYTPEVLRHGELRWLKPAGLAALAIAGVAVVAGVVTRGVASASLKTTAAAAAISTVDLIAPTADTSAEPLVLPADVEANDVAAIHPRVSGYIRKWDVDIGAHVKAGQLLADIDTPDLDQQLAQARASPRSPQTAGPASWPATPSPTRRPRRRPAITSSAPPTSRPPRPTSTGSRRSNPSSGSSPPSTGW
jgi:hypothetical protein